MREIVNFRDRQEVQAADFTNLQLYARASFDDLIRDAISDGKGFAGFEVTQATSSDVSVAAGRFYTAGAMYYRDTATTVQLASMLPLVAEIKRRLTTVGDQHDVLQMAADLARLKELVGLPSDQGLPSSIRAGCRKP